jgi:putative endonuclease
MKKIENFLFFGISALGANNNEMKFFTYILISEKDGSLYIGQTQDVQKRLDKHNGGKNVYTSEKRPWKLLFAKEVDSRSEAMKLERYLKSLKKREAVFKWIDGKNHGV